ncbi:Protein of unknown function DUF3431 [Macrophomina phaseolina MS6]|uniref:Piwi domain-containing protein n=1 Tax=Macrophomina phaseolina (strain MS6) TaxID=1126212 RepID=K2RTC7_MACPH|nr:Protein of unknown function DUF3431 [Macrophomina phaseolina MS6]
MHCSSIASVVGSFDEYVVNYSSSMRSQGSHRALRIYKRWPPSCSTDYGKKNKRLPSNIIFYRDDLSERQYHEVCETEAKAIEKAWMALKASAIQQEKVRLFKSTSAAWRSILRSPDHTTSGIRLKMEGTRVGRYLGIRTLMTRFSGLSQKGRVLRRRARRVNDGFFRMLFGVSLGDPMHGSAESGGILRTKRCARR